ncbi:HK97-gp10 family putative phage morphogenesis protein [Yersinia aleksiciae]|uniref:HK97-gp10 family putative phage morphogenesis protein n=1 Tax=Yersinia aleksiciae TaxID=263819 RepID=UPI0011AA19D4|nr:HK97-gp10 family putative phage morphogenesis protein [Yersinia aleksiciae]
MIDTHLDFSGMLDLDKELELLSKAESRTVLRQAVRAGAAVIQAEARNRAAERTGKLKRNIIIANGKGDATQASAGIRVRGANPSGTNSDNTKKAVSRSNSFYWRFIELGTSKLPATPFIRPAFDSNADAAAQVTIDRAIQAIDEVLAK